MWLTAELERKQHDVAGIAGLRPRRGRPVRRDSVEGDIDVPHAVDSHVDGERLAVHRPGTHRKKGSAELVREPLGALMLGHVAGREFETLVQALVTCNLRSPRVGHRNIKKLAWREQADGTAMGVIHD